MRLGLVAIVKDEASIIGRMLASVRPWISAYAIVDTGSTDGTQDVIPTSLSETVGAIENFPWRGFAESRNDALRLARSVAQCHALDALLMMDADHVLHVDDRLPQIGDFDCLQVEHRYGTLSYTLPILMSLRPDLRYEMPVHEFLTGDVPLAQARAAGMWVDVHTDGARSRRTDKFAADAAALREFLAEHPDHPRATYYLAQSLRDAGQFPEALAAYLARTRLSGWPEETWSAFYEAAKIIERLHANDPASVAHAYLRSYGARPSRAEPLVALARWHRLHGEFPQAALYAERALTIPYPTDFLFVEPDDYAWRALDELAISGYYAGAPSAKPAMQRLLDERRFPDSEAPRIQANAAFYAA